VKLKSFITGAIWSIDVSEKIPLLIDTDPGVDDALAILMAFAAPTHEVVGLTVSAGNVGLPHTVRNALKLCEVAARADIPVFPGCAQPLVHPAPDAAEVHGQDGFGDIGLPPAAHAAQSEHAALAIIRLSHEYAGRLQVVALGPLSNLALALRLERIARLVVMGGAVTAHGNITATAEFNFYFDPEAAHIVTQSFPQLDLADWEATLAHGLAYADLEQWLAQGDQRAQCYSAISSKTRHWAKHRDELVWHVADALAMAWALEPDAAQDVQARPLEIALAIIRLSHEYAGRLQVVALGPLSNLALALRLETPSHARVGLQGLIIRVTSPSPAPVRPVSALAFCA